MGKPKHHVINPDDCKSWHHLYKTARWLRLRDQQLQREPLCQKCKTKDITEPATVAHHIHPHRGDLTLFFTGALESLCKRCHDYHTQGEERRGHSNEIGPDGWPVDVENHPVYRSNNKKQKPGGD